MSQLKTGYTTGSCALAASKCATILLFENKIIDNIQIRTPLNKQLTIEVFNHQINNGVSSCFVYKDGGDDADATHGLEIYAYVKKIEKGIILKGGSGVGIVTRKGLKVPVGSPAINPVPYKMIVDEIEMLMKAYNYEKGLEITIVVPCGKKIAHKTFNARLGIVDGISILGTTGIVEPMSERALIETIKVEMDFFIQNNSNNIMVLSPGNYGQAFLKDNLALDDAIKYSNFIGESLDYAREIGVKRILIISHIGKLVKVAGAIMNTHSKYADARNEIFCAYAAINGVDINLLKRIMEATTSLEINEILLLSNKKKQVYDSITKSIISKIDYRVQNEIQVEVIGFTNEDGILVESNNALKYLEIIKESYK